MMMAAKFAVGDAVTTKYGEGHVTYVTPEDKLGTLPGPKGPDGKPGPEVPREQRYHVMMDVGDTSYDFDESELTKATPKPAEPKPAQPVEPAKPAT
jgi:hypothetical protein